MKVFPQTLLDSLLNKLSSEDNFVFLDSSKNEDGAEASLLFLNPVKKITFVCGDDVSQFFSQIESAQKSGNYVAGWVSYELGYLLEENSVSLFDKTNASTSILAELGVFKKVNVFNHTSGQHDFPIEEVASDQFRASYKLQNVAPNIDYTTYLGAISTIKELIAAGDTYQVNYTLKMKFAFSGSQEELYRDLRRNQSVSYGAFIRFGDKYTLSFSPELFFSIKGDTITMKPMKGTVKKGNTSDDELVYSDFLYTDIKNRSENVMIVDLLRNDLGRLMHNTSGGNVSVKSLFEVESYETLLQMTSTIKAKGGIAKKGRFSVESVFKALFPCGSITGAPKIRTMQIIQQLEKEDRGIYTGAIGYFAPNGDATFNVPIRTVTLNGNNGEMGIGSGIVHDSEPESEWDECLLKANFLTKPVADFELIETILWNNDGTGFFLLKEHMHRLQKSAQYFLFTVNIQSILNLLKAKDVEYKKDKTTCMRVRITVAKDSTVSCFEATCEAPDATSLPEYPDPKTDSKTEIGICDDVINTDTPWFYHKTTNRELFNTYYQNSCDKGLADICFVNSKGEVTEGCISNIIVYRNGHYVTPSLSSGLLAGVMRTHLLESEEVQLLDEVLFVEDLYNAEAIFLCNGIRGVRQVSLRKKAELSK